MPQSRTSNSQSDEETGDDSRKGASDGAGVDRKVSSPAAQNTTGNSTSGLDGAAQEGCTTLLLNGFVEVGLAPHKGAVCDAGSVGEGGSELDVLVEDVAGTGLAELLSGKRGLNAKEDQVCTLELFQVGDDHLLLGTARVLGSKRLPEAIGGRRTGGEEVLAGSRVGGANLENTVVSVVGLGADGLGQREEGVENVVSADHVGIGGGSELIRAGGVEVGELTADYALRTSRQAWAEAVQG